MLNRYDEADPGMPGQIGARRVPDQAQPFKCQRTAGTDQKIATWTRSRRCGRPRWQAHPEELDGRCRCGRGRVWLGDEAGASVSVSGPKEPVRDVAEGKGV